MSISTTPAVTTASAWVTNTAVQLRPGHRCHDQVLYSRERRDSTALLWIPSRRCPTILRHFLAVRGNRGQLHELLHGAYSKLDDWPGSLRGIRTMLHDVHCGAVACFMTRQACPHRRQDMLHERSGLLRGMGNMLGDALRLLRGAHDVLHDVPGLHCSVDNILRGISAYIATRLERFRTPSPAQETRYLDTANASRRTGMMR